MDKNEIDKLIENFRNDAKPNNRNTNDPVDKGDLIKLVDKLADLLKKIT